MIFFIFPFVFLFSLITYFMKDEIFSAWWKFTYKWALLTMILVLITPGGSGSFFPSLISPGVVAFLMSCLFAIISIVIIIVKLIQTHKK